MTGKPVIWVGSSLAAVRAFPRDARRRAGHELHLVQLGLAPGDSKPIHGVGPGVREIRIHTRGEYRVFYVAKYPEAIYVVHGFEKRSAKTRQVDIQLARARLGLLTQARRRGER